MSSTSRNRKKYLKINNKKNINSVIVNPISSRLYRENNSLKLSPNISTLCLVEKSPNNHKIFKSPNNTKLKERIFSSKDSNKNIFDCESLFISISSKIESIIFAYKENKIKLCDILRKIENYIYQIIKEKNLNININGRTSKLTFENNVKALKEKLKKYNNKIILDESNKKVELNNFILKRKINKLYKKINEMETEFKNEELKYFFCIGDYQKRLDELEQKINLIEIERMPKKELRKFICYPHYHKFDLNEDANIKAIPMFNSRKKKCNSSQPSNRYDNEIKKTSLSNSILEYNSFENNITKINRHKPNDCNFESFEEKNIFSHSYDNGSEDINLKDKNINEIIDTIKLGKNNFDIKQNVIYRFLGKEKNFFVSHPKLNYIKIGKNGNRLISLKFDNQISTFPKQISNLNVSKSQKNTMFLFPSSFKETMVNLEKLRTRKNFRNIENANEESWKLKAKSYKIKN